MLEGIKVLDLSRILAGPYCGALLADLGADVVKVERPGRGDDLRWLRGGKGITASFASLNRNKRGIAINLQNADGQKLAFEMATRADVVIENFLPGETTKFGIGFEQVAAVNPRVVYASITGFGQTGPYARRAGYNSVALGMSGYMALTGMPDHPPTRPGGSLADTASALVAFGAINAALVGRSISGRGAYIDVSLLASTLALVPDPVANYFESGQRPRRLGNRSPSVTPGEPFQARDGLVTIVLTSPEQWARFCEVLDDPAMKDDPKFKTNFDRLQHHAEFKARVEARLAAADVADWVEKFAARSIAVGPVYEFDQVFDDPQVRHLGLVTELDQPGLGVIHMLNSAMRISPSGPRIRRPAPLLGQHTREVLVELGYDEARIAELAASGAIEVGPDPAARPATNPT